MGKKIISKLQIISILLLLAIIPTIAISLLTSPPAHACVECQEEPEEESSEDTSSDAPRVDTGGHRGANTRAFTRSLVSMIEEMFGMKHGSWLYDHWNGSFIMSSKGADSSYLVATTDTDTVALFANSIPPKLHDLICKTQIMTGKHQDYKKSRPLMALIISGAFEIPYNMVMSALQDPFMCENVLEIRQSLYGPLARAPEMPEADKQFAFAVDSKGIPVSTDFVWNACIRNTLAFDSSGRPFRCKRNFHSGNKWYHPDYENVEFAFNYRRPWALELPTNFQVVMIDELDPYKQLVAARDINQTVLVAAAESEETVTVTEEPRTIRNTEQTASRLNVNAMQRKLQRIARNGDAWWL